MTKYDSWKSICGDGTSCLLSCFQLVKQLVKCYRNRECHFLNWFYGLQVWKWLNLWLCSTQFIRYLSRKLYLNLKLKMQEGDLVNMFGGKVLDANQVRNRSAEMFWPKNWSQGCVNSMSWFTLQCAKHYKCELEGDALIKKFAPLFPIRNPTYAARQWTSNCMSAVSCFHFVR